MPDFVYVWDGRLRGGAGGYRDASNGRIVGNMEARNVLDQTIQAAKGNESVRLMELLRGQQISLADWQRSMRDVIKDTHLAAMLAQRGGIENVTQSDYGRVGRIIRDKYEALDNFAKQIADGTQPLDGRALVRAQMYQDDAITTYETFSTIYHGAAGFNQERSVLDQQARHCKDCIDQDAKGWQTIGNMIPIGQRQCNVNDRCSHWFRNSLTGEEVQ